MSTVPTTLTRNADEQGLRFSVAACSPQQWLDTPAILQAANHVIHYTRPWNPAKEDQATDRAYRIGQDKPVTVYYPTVHHDDFVTFEERLDELLTEKREIAAKTWLNGAADIRLEEFGNFSDATGETMLPD